MVFFKRMGGMEVVIILHTTFFFKFDDFDMRDFSIDRSVATNVADQ